MKVSDLKDSDIKVGLRIRSLKDPAMIGEVFDVKYPPEDRHQYAWVRWPNGHIGGFFENQCDCEVAEDALDTNPKPQ